MEDLGKEARRTLTNAQIPFANRILCIGCGGVAQCTLPILPKLIRMPLTNITVIDKVDTSSRIADLIAQGVTFHVEKIDKSNFESVLSKYITTGDLILDLAYEIATKDFLQWCNRNGVLYINASVEEWDPYMDPQTEDARNFTLYSRHTGIRQLKAEWGSNSGPTAVLDHGANPGLVSHFIKLALQHIADKVISDVHKKTCEGLSKPAHTNGCTCKPVDPVQTARATRIADYKSKRQWNYLAMELGVKVIHISERDTQISSVPKEVGEFVNTWSPEGLYEEGVAPAELGWGTHERTLPANALEHRDGPRNQILLKSKGINTTVRSWVPTGDIIGYVIRHGEAYTISDHLTVDDPNTGEALYRPTVHYAYRPSDSTVASIEEMRMNHYKMHQKMKVLNDEITSGQDVLGCLLMGHDYKSWWIGSLLDIKEARELVPHQNATTMQVAISLASAVQWMIKNPTKGICVPDDLPHEEILEQCWPWLGPCISKPVDWSPVAGIKAERAFDYERRPVPTSDETWQFSSFLVNSY